MSVQGSWCSLLPFKTIEDVRAVRHGDFLDVQQPRPYPGRYPTRVAWYLGYKVPRWYMGRPNLLQLSLPQKTQAARRVSVQGWEFDRGGIVATWIAGHYGQPSSLWKYYHPHQRPGTWFEGFLPWFEVKREGDKVFYVPGNVDMLQKLQQAVVNVQLDAFANVVAVENAPAAPPVPEQLGAVAAYIRMADEFASRRR